EYPFLAILAAIFPWKLIRIIKTNSTFTGKNALLLSFFLIVAIFYRPYADILEISYIPDALPGTEPIYDLSYILQKAVEKGQAPEANTILYGGYTTTYYLYVGILNDRGMNLQCGDWQNPITGDRAIVAQYHVAEYLN